MRETPPLATILILLFFLLSPIVRAIRERWLAARALQQEMQATRAIRVAARPLEPPPRPAKRRRGIADVPEEVALARARPVVAVAPPARPAAPRARIGPRDLRRGIVLATILGRPRGLGGDDPLGPLGT
jgi:hypothetical protein